MANSCQIKQESAYYTITGHFIFRINLSNLQNRPAKKHERVSSTCVFLSICSSNYFAYRGGFHGSTSPHLPRPLTIPLPWQPIASFPILCPAVPWGSVRGDEELSSKILIIAKKNPLRRSQKLQHCSDSACCMLSCVLYQPARDVNEV